MLNTFFKWLSDKRSSPVQDQQFPKISRLVEAFSFEMQAEMETRYSSDSSLISPRYELMQRMRDSVSNLTDLVYAEPELPVLVREEAAHLAVTAMKIAEAFGELLPTTEEQCRP